MTHIANNFKQYSCWHYVYDGRKPAEKRQTHCKDAVSHKQAVERGGFVVHLQQDELALIAKKGVFCGRRICDVCKPAILRHYQEPPVSKKEIPMKALVISRLNSHADSTTGEDAYRPKAVILDYNENDINGILADYAKANGETDLGVLRAEEVKLIEPLVDAVSKQETQDDLTVGDLARLVQKLAANHRDHVSNVQEFMQEARREIQENQADLAHEADRLEERIRDLDSELHEKLALKADI